MTTKYAPGVCLVPAQTLASLVQDNPYNLICHWVGNREEDISDVAVMVRLCSFPVEAGVCLGMGSFGAVAKACEAAISPPATPYCLQDEPNWHSQDAGMDVPGSAHILLGISRSALSPHKWQLRSASKVSYCSWYASEP